MEISLLPKLTNSPLNCYSSQWCMTPPSGCKKYCSHSCVLEIHHEFRIALKTSWTDPSFLSSSEETFCVKQHDFTIHSKCTVIKIIPIVPQWCVKTLFRQHYSKQFIIRVLGFTNVLSNKAYWSVLFVTYLWDWCIWGGLMQYCCLVD